ncbi:phosphodiester glycosidase family protein [Coraliomargarita parva]|uniref:phosphodiester glycosidase family protein n=1 Tax=Coraliomargarita parva TaxID=3014050 RepID=UPI0022B3DC95|nr:phosphodiester glycosidase family protein [Coraliomargarita parva]
MKIIIASLLILGSVACAERSFIVEKEGVSIHAIEFRKDENLDFELIDGAKKKSYVSDHYSPESNIFTVNAGYFDGNLNPIGYFRIDGKAISTTRNPKLSGFITITDKGKLSLHWKDIPEGEYRDVLQAGPFIIDPGGTIGIHARSGKEAKRTVIGQTEDERILVLTTTEVFLYDLARILKSEIPELERALNLDGGPSVGLIYGDTRIKNANPVRNFLTKRKGEPDAAVNASQPAGLSENHLHD